MASKVGNKSDVLMLSDCIFGGEMTCEVCGNTLYIMYKAKNEQGSFKEIINDDGSEC